MAPVSVVVDPLRAEREYFLAHRIDKETSGVLVLAKEKEICAGLTAQFAARQTRKLSWYEWNRGDDTLADIVALAEKTSGAIR